LDHSRRFRGSSKASSLVGEFALDAYQHPAVEVQNLTEELAKSLRWGWRRHDQRRGWSVDPRGHKSLAPRDGRFAPIALGILSALILLIGFIDHREVDRRIRELSDSPVVPHAGIGLDLTIAAGILGLAAAGTRLGNRSAGGR
jgi:hypothetical protein